MSGKIVTVSLATALLFASVTAAFAGGTTTSQSVCYHQVIKTCSKNEHPVLCNRSGMKACDRKHAAALNSRASRETKPNVSIILQSGQ